MKNYVINLKDAATGSTSAIDNIVADDNYTAEQYIRDCKENADDDWCKMLENGIVTLEEID